MSESRLRGCPSDIVAKPGDSVGQLGSVRSPVGKVKCAPRGCQRFCQVGAIAVEVLRLGDTVPRK